MIVKELTLPAVKLLTPKQIEDERGFFAETLNEREMQRLGFPGIYAQENQSISFKKGTVRGLHAQKPPHAQGKLIRVLKGRIYDVAVDVRPLSPTFGKHVEAILSDGELTMFYIPSGFLHGFCTLTDDTVVLYKVTELYAPGSEVGVFWNDPALGIDWPVKTDAAILSAKDKALPLFKDFPHLEWTAA